MFLDPLKISFFWDKNVTSDLKIVLSLGSIKN